jgi:BirA family biotin operon repressor/biotin-[acetyl-CoA-carboxylase] ligase
MNEHALRKALSELPLGDFRFFTQTGSTNDVALAWAAEGAPDLSLVWAEAQTAGRGRGSRQWFTPPESALAFSLILRPGSGANRPVQLFSGLGAVAVSEVIRALGLSPEIKWPNDVLLKHWKVCGILAEAVWTGNEIDSIILGIGVNVKPESVPSSNLLSFPATSLEVEIGKEVDRSTLLQDILRSLLHWRDLLGTDLFIHTWEEQLAFRGEQVEIRDKQESTRMGVIEGLEIDGRLRLHDIHGKVFMVSNGEVHLRPVL